MTSTTFKIAEFNPLLGTFSIQITYTDGTTEEFSVEVSSLVATKNPSVPEILNALKSVVTQREKEKYSAFFIEPDIISGLVGTVHSLGQ